jgi:hypothetical protein
MAETLGHRGSAEARASGEDVGTTITAVLDARADDGSTCRYCLARWTPSGPSATYTFLYRV